MGAGRTHSVLLSHNVGVTIDDQGVELNKITASANAHIKLNFKEWFGIAEAMGDLNARVKHLADSIFHHVLNGENMQNEGLENYEQVISEKVAVGVSVFKPKTRHFISVSIRSYFYNKEGKIMFKKSPGITLNQDQFNSLKCQMHYINDFIFTLPKRHNHESSEEYDSCGLCSIVYLHSSEDPSETNLRPKKMEFTLKCRDPAAFIPAYRRIHEFVQNGEKDSFLFVNLQKCYNGTDFTLSTTHEQSLPPPGCDSDRKGFGDYSGRPLNDNEKESGMEGDTTVMVKEEEEEEVEIVTISDVSTTSGTSPIKTIPLSPQYGSSPDNKRKRPLNEVLSENDQSLDIIDRSGSEQAASPFKRLVTLHSGEKRQKMNNMEEEEKKKPGILKSVVLNKENGESCFQINAPRAPPPAKPETKTKDIPAKPTAPALATGGVTFKDQIGGKKNAIFDRNGTNGHRENYATQPPAAATAAAAAAAALAAAPPAAASASQNVITAPTEAEIAEELHKIRSKSVPRPPPPPPAPSPSSPSMAQDNNRRGSGPAANNSSRSSGASRALSMPSLPGGGEPAAAGSLARSGPAELGAPGPAGMESDKLSKVTQSNVKTRDSSSLSPSKKNFKPFEKHLLSNDDFYYAKINKESSVPRSSVIANHENDSSINDAPLPRCSTPIFNESTNDL